MIPAVWSKPPEGVRDGTGTVPQKVKLFRYAHAYHTSRQANAFKCTFKIRAFTFTIDNV